MQEPDLVLLRAHRQTSARYKVDTDNCCVVQYQAQTTVQPFYNYKKSVSYLQIPTHVYFLNMLRDVICAHPSQLP